MRAVPVLLALSLACLGCAKPREVQIIPYAINLKLTYPTPAPSPTPDPLPGFFFSPDERNECGKWHLDDSLWDCQTEAE